MIAVSDAVLIVLSATLLAAGLYRWQGNLEQARAVTSQTEISSETAPSPDAQLLPPALNEGSAPSQQPLDTTAITDPVSPEQPSASGDPGIDTPPPLRLGQHVTVSGDTLSIIAGRYGTTVEALREVNNISGSLIEVGQIILYPLEPE